MKVYRFVDSYSILDSQDQMPYIISLLYSSIQMIGFVYIYILINNILAKSSKFNYLMMISVLFILFSSILTANRTEFARYPVSAISIYYFLWCKINISRHNVNFKLVFGFLLVLLLIFISVSATRSLVGRTSTADPIQYIANYIGAPVEGLDLFLKSYHSQTSTIWGKETFSGLNNFIGKLLFIPELRYIGHREFRFSNGVNIGNVYTSFRSYIHDFGYYGFVILTFLLGLFSMWFHLLVKKSVNDSIMMGQINYHLLIYGYYIYFIFMEFYASEVYSLAISFGISRNIVLMLIFGKYICNNKHENRNLQKLSLSV